MLRRRSRVGRASAPGHSEAVIRLQPFPIHRLDTTRFCRHKCALRTNTYRFAVQAHASGVDISEATYAIARAGLESPIGTTIPLCPVESRSPLSQRKAPMVKAAISGLAMAALQVFAAEPAPTIGQHCIDMRIVSSDANARQLKLGYKKAVVIDLPVDIKEVLVADPATVTVLVRTMRRVYITGVALGKTNIFFFDDGGRQIAALDVSVSEFAQPHPLE
jgi:hypothetical protein